MSDSIYPNGIDGYSQLPLAIDTVTRIDADSVNRLRNAIVNVETELGVNPSGVYVDVRTRLDNIDGQINNLEERVEILENATPPTPGGGGDVIIPDGGTIGGSYESDVICLGQVTATSAVDVGNNLVVRGEFINNGGWPVTVRGSFHAQNLSFNHSNPIATQGNIQVDGEFTFTRIEFEQGGGTAATLTVGGNLTCISDAINAGIYASGLNRSTPGLDIYVYGNLNSPIIESNGSPGNIIFPGGNGGFISVTGSINSSVYLNAYGGDSANSSGGAGGGLYCGGNISINNISLYGGEDSNGDGGNGGYLTVTGTTTAGNLNIYGGRGFSGLGGDGGTIDASGNLTCENMNLYGGRGDAGRGGNGGSATLNGAVKMNNLNVYGGRGTGVAGGDAGYINIYGNSNFEGSINMYGGLGILAGGGNGGLLYIRGDIYIDNNILMSGGVGANGAGGDGGNIDFIGNTSVRDIQISGGNSALDNGGNGGTISIEGNLNVRDITANGGNSTSDSIIHRSGTGGSLTVGGNLLGQWIPGTINMNGGLRQSLFPTKPLFPGTETPPNGGSIEVGGNINFDQINLNGGQVLTTAINPHAAGSGGYLICRGDVNIISALYLAGGNSTTSDSGFGGLLYIYSDFHTETLNMSGGEASDGNSGGGGVAAIKGDVIAKFIELNGGLCTSTDVAHASGSGGELYISGDLIEQYIAGLLGGGSKVSGTININGGARTGTFVGVTPPPGGLTPPNGGTLEVYGGVSFTEISISGGEVSTVNFNPHSAGNGGYFYVGLSSSIGQLAVSGGNSTVSNAGNGGEIYTYFTLSVLNAITASGGDSSNGNGGDAGYLDVNCGDLHASTLDFSGGSGISGNGGAGTIINIYLGNIYINSSMNCSGGNCNSVDETHEAGPGGYIYIYSGSLYMNSGVLSLTGGNRSGATTISNLFASSPYGGALVIQNGDLKSSSGTINASGGNVTTSYPNAAGGAGGEILIEGSIICNQIIINGGSAVGSNGGPAGIIESYGLLSVSTITGNGGNSNNSVLGGDAAVGGPGGGVYIYSGANVTTLTLLDGTGAFAPTSLTSLRLAGSCTFNSINMANRANSRISAQSGGFGISYSSVMLKVNSMPTKTTLNNTAGVATGSIAAILNNSIFIVGPTTGTWFGIAGVAV